MRLKVTGQKVAGPKKKSAFLPPGATVYNENFAKSYLPFDKSKVEEYIMRVLSRKTGSSYEKV